MQLRKEPDILKLLRHVMRAICQSDQLKVLSYMCLSEELPYESCADLRAHDQISIHANLCENIMVSAYCD